MGLCVNIVWRLPCVPLAVLWPGMLLVTDRLAAQVMTLRQQLKEQEAQGARQPGPKFGGSRGPPGPPGPSRGHEQQFRHDSRGPGGWNSPPGQGLPGPRMHEPRGYDSRRGDDRKRSPPLDLHDDRYSRRQR